MSAMRPPDWTPEEQALADLLEAAPRDLAEAERVEMRKAIQAVPPGAALRMMAIRLLREARKIPALRAQVEGLTAENERLTTHAASLEKRNELLWNRLAAVTDELEQAEARERGLREALATIDGVVVETPYGTYKAE